MKEEEIFARYEQDGVVVVHPRREVLDLTVAKEFAEVLDRVSRTDGSVLIDLANVSYLDSVIISVLVKHYVALRQRGKRLILFDLQEYVEELLKSTGLLNVMDIRYDLDSAMKLAPKPLEQSEVERYGRRDDSEL